MKYTPVASAHTAYCFSPSVSFRYVRACGISFDNIIGTKGIPGKGSESPVSARRLCRPACSVRVRAPF